MNVSDAIIKIFENHSIEIYCEEIKDKKYFYFKANDIGNILNIVNIRTSIQNFDIDEAITKPSKDGKGVIRNTNFLTSRGIYRLLYASRKPIAIKFRKWVGDILDDIIFNESNEVKKKYEEMDIRFKFLQMKYNEEVQERDKEVNWLHYITKDQVSFSKFLIKSDNVYIGSSEFEHKNYIEKIGNTINLKRRERELRTANASINCFELHNKYKLFSEMGPATEKYIHAILKPLRIISGKSTEHFMIHKSFADKVIKNIVQSQNECIADVNNYIDLLEENDFSYDVVEDLL